jgi:hypothetical protein
VHAYRKGACFIAGGFYAPLADDLKSSQRNSFFTMMKVILNEKLQKRDFDRNEKKSTLKSSQRI